jgi:TatD DNase family protein
MPVCRSTRVFPRPALNFCESFSVNELFDAHNHLHDPRLDGIRETAIALLGADGIRRAIVNGTREDDWPAVAALAARVPWVIPSFGLHPWHVPARSPHWKEALASAIEAHPSSGVGEIGLDRWIEGHNLPDQLECFTHQLALAARWNRPASIHCIQAWGALWDALKSTPLPARGFLIHAYGGPAEMLPGFIRLGAYFSFSPYFLHDRNGDQRAAFAAMPRDRILVETDAPDLAPPLERNPNPLADGVNHPANLELSYQGLADVRGLPLDELAAQVAENFRRWTAE